MSSTIDTTTPSIVSSTTTPSTTAAAPTTTSAAPPTTSSIPPTTTTVPSSTSITSIAPTSTTYIAPTTVIPSTSIIAITSTVTQSPTNNGTPSPSIVTITSTQAVVTTPGVTTSPTRSSSSTSSSASTTQSALSASGNAVQSKGLSNGATIAIAVIIPIVAVAAAIIFGILFWRRRRNRKEAEEQRKNEMAEYGFNPNNDPTLPVGVAAYNDGESEANDDSGYRGWGATTVSNRKTSTTLGSNSRAAAMGGATGAMSDGGSQAGGYNQPSPSAGAGSDGTQEPLMQAHQDTTVPAAVAGGAVGGAAVTGATLAALNSNSARNQRFSSSIHRGPSNASSAYSAGGARSEVSSEHNPMPAPYTYQEEVPYNIYNEGQNPYGDGAQHNETPVIRDVQARRNTRIERAPTFPQQGGIAQNF